MEEAGVELKADGSAAFLSALTNANAAFLNLSKTVTAGTSVLAVYDTAVDKVNSATKTLSTAQTSAATSAAALKLQQSGVASSLATVRAAQEAAASSALALRNAQVEAAKAGKDDAAASANLATAQAAMAAAKNNVIAATNNYKQAQQAEAMAVSASKLAQADAIIAAQNLKAAKTSLRDASVDLKTQTKAEESALKTFETATRTAASAIKEQEMAEQAIKEQYRSVTDILGGYAQKITLVNVAKTALKTVTVAGQVALDAFKLSAAGVNQVMTLAEGAAGKVVSGFVAVTKGAIDATGALTTFAAKATVGLFEGLISGAVQAGEALFNLSKRAVEVGATFIKESVKMAADYEANMNRVRYMTDATAGEMQAYTKATIEIGKTTTFSSKEAAVALADLAQQGFKNKDAIDLMAASAKAAMINNTSLKDATEVLTSTTAAFGLAAQDSDRVLNVLTRANQLGKIAFEDFNMTMSRVGGTAKAAGMPIESVTSSLIALTNTGMTTTRASQMLNSSIVSLERPNKVAAAEIEKLGLSVYDSAGNMRSLTDITAQLADKTKDMTMEQRNYSMAAIFGRANIVGFQDMLGAQARVMKDGSEITLRGADALRYWTSEMQNSQGAADAAAKVMQQGLNYQFKQLRGSVQEAMITIGTPFLKPMAALVQATTQVVNAFIDWEQKTKIVSGSVTKVFGGLSKGIINSFNEIAQGFTNKIPVFEGDQYITPFTRIGKALRTEVIPTIENFVKAASSGMNTFIKVMEPVGAKVFAVAEAFNPLKTAIDTVNGVITGGLQGALQGLETGVVNAASALNINLLPTFGAINRIIFSEFAPAFQTVGFFINNDVVPALESIGNTVSTSVIPVFEDISKFITGTLLLAFLQVGEFITTNVVPAFNSIVIFISTKLIPSVLDFASTIINTALPVLLQIGRFITDKVVPPFLTLASVFTDKVLPAAADLFAGIIDAAKPFIPFIENIITSVAIPAFIGFANILADDVLPAVTSVFEWIGNNATPVLGNLGKTFQEVFNWIGNNVGPIFASLSNTFQTVIIPAFERFGSYITGQVVPKLQVLWNFVDSNILPVFSKFAAFIADPVIPVLGKVAEFIGDKVIPTIVNIASAIGEGLAPFLKFLAEFIGDKVIPAFANMANFIGNTILPALGKFADYINAEVVPIIKSIMEYVGFLLIGALKTFETVWSATWDIVAAVAKVVWATLETIFQGIERGAKAIALAVKGDFIGAWNALTESSGGVYKALNSILEDLPAFQKEFGNTELALASALAMSKDFGSSLGVWEDKTNKVTQNLGPMNTGLDGTSNAASVASGNIKGLNDALDYLRESSNKAAQAMNESKRTLSDLDSIVATMPKNVQDLWQKWKDLDQQVRDGTGNHKELVGQLNDTRNALTELDPRLAAIASGYSSTEDKLKSATQSWQTSTIAAANQAKEIDKTQRIIDEHTTATGRMTAATELAGTSLGKTGTKADELSVAVSRMKNNTSVAVDSAVTKFGELPIAGNKAVGDLKGAVSRTDLASSGLNMGASLVTGFINGIASKVQAAANAASNMVGNAISAAKSMLGMASPSRVFHNIAEMSVAGWEGGFEQNADKPVRAVTRIVDGMVKAASKSTEGTGGGKSGPVSVMKGIIDDLDNVALEAAAKQAEFLSKIAEGTTKMIEALGKLRGWQGPLTESIDGFVYNSRQLIDRYVTYSQEFTKKAIDGVTEFAGAVGSIADGTGKMADALTKLRDWQGPINASIEGFMYNMKLLVDLYFKASLDFDEKMVKGVELFSTTASNVADTTGKMADSLQKLQNWKGIINPSVEGFVYNMKVLMLNYYTASTEFNETMFKGVTAFADAGSKVADVTGKMADALQKLQNWVGVINPSIEGFVYNMKVLMLNYYIASTEFNDKMLGAVAKFAETGSKVADTTGKMADSLSKLKNWEGVLTESIEGFVYNAKVLALNFYIASTEFNDDMLKAVNSFADTLTKVGAATSSMFNALKDLPGYVKIGDGIIAAFANDTRSLTLAFWEASKTFNSDMLSAVAKYAETLGKVAQGASSAFSLLNSLRDYVEVGIQSIESFGRNVKELTNTLQVVAVQFNEDALKAMGAFGEAINKLFGGLKAAVDVFGGLREYVTVPSNMINAFIDDIQLTVRLAGDLAAATDKDLLAQVAKFGEATGKLFGGLKSAMDVFKGMRDKEFKEQPSITMETFIAEITKTVTLAGNMADQTDRELLAKAQDFAAATDKIFSKLKSAMDVFKSLKDLKDVPVDMAATLVNAIITAVNKMADAVNGAGNFVEKAEKIEELTQKALDAMIGAANKAVSFKNKALDFKSALQDGAAAIREGADAVAAAARAAGDAAAVGGTANVATLFTGTPSWKGGEVMVGDQGPEIYRTPDNVLGLVAKPVILDLPKGTEVFNAADTRSMINNSVSRVSHVSNVYHTNHNYYLSVTSQQPVSSVVHSFEVMQAWAPI